MQIESNFFFAVFRANLAAESAGLRQCHTKYATDPHFLSSNDASLEVRNVHVSMSNGILSNLLLKHNLMTLTPDNYLIGQICLLFAKFNDFFGFMYYFVVFI